MNLKIYILLLILVAIGLSTDIRMVCAEGKMNVTFIKYDVINDSVIYENVSTINLDLLFEKLNESGINVDPINIARGPDYVEFNYTPLYNYGPYNYVKTAISNGNLTLRFRIYYDGTAQVCAISDKLFKEGYLSDGYITDAVLLAPLMRCSTTTDSDGPWSYSYSSCSWSSVDSNIVYLQWILKEAVDYTNFHLYDVFQKEYQDYKNNLLNITDNYIYFYNLTINPVDTYITGFGDWYLITANMRGSRSQHLCGGSISVSLALQCNSNNSYIYRYVGSWFSANDYRGKGYNIFNKVYVNNYYVYGPIDTNGNIDSNTNTVFISKESSILNNKLVVSTNGCYEAYADIYYFPHLIKSKYNYITCSFSGSYTTQKKFASGYGTGRAVKDLSSPISTPGRPINVTVYIDPPRAKYVKITDYVPKDFGWDKTITIERRKLGNETPIQTQTLTVKPVSNGDDLVYTLSGQTINILQNLSNEEYIEIKYQLITPTTNVQRQYNVKGVDVVYAPQL